MIRLEKPLPERAVAELNETFQDLVASGKIARTAALPEEEDQPELKSKPRITFRYDRGRAGRLNEMILAINRLGRDA